MHFSTSRFKMQLLPRPGAQSSSISSLVNVMHIFKFGAGHNWLLLNLMNEARLHWAAKQAEAFVFSADCLSLFSAIRPSPITNQPPCKCEDSLLRSSRSKNRDHKIPFNLIFRCPSRVHHSQYSRYVISGCLHLHSVQRILHPSCKDGAPAPLLKNSEEETWRVKVLFENNVLDFVAASFSCY